MNEFELLEKVNYSAISSFLRGLKPDPLLTVSEWADERRILPPTSAEPGPYRTSRTPYFKEIQDKLSVSNSAQVIIVMKSSQVGATESANNWIGSIIDVTPGPTMYIMPTDQMMKDTSKSRIQKMIDTTPDLSRKVMPARSKNSNNTILNKEFEGGFVKMVGANSPVGLASTAIRFLYMDEVDRYPLDVGGEGSPMDLAKTRTLTFGARKKMYITSTPTMEGSSVIDNAFKETGQRYFQVPCPLCGAQQKLIFSQLKWEKGKYDQVYYECAHCQEPIKERYKTKMLASGEWIPDFPEKEDGIKFGYHINALYSPYGWYSWAEMAKESDDAEGDAPKMIAFTNTKKGETYKAESDSPEWQAVYNKRETYKIGTPPEKVVFVTMGADVQKDRIELEIVGWCKGLETYSIDYRVLLGTTDTEGSAVWEELTKVLDTPIIREDGAVMHVKILAIDSGFNTSEVYKYCRKFPGNKVIPIKGQDGQSLMVSPPRTVDTSRSGKKIGDTKVWNVGISIIKTQLYGWLKLNQNTDDGSYPAGYCHFPQYDAHYFKGITAEKLQRETNRQGYTVWRWAKHFERNEPLDCRVYARAAAYVIGVDRFSPEQWDKFLIETKDLIPAEQPEIKKAIKKNRGGSYWNK